MNPKKVLIITSNSEKTVAWKERELYIREFCKGIEELLDNTIVMYTTYDDLQFVVQAGNTSIWDTRNSFDLRELSLVHFKNWEYEPEEAPIAALYLKMHSIPFYNSEVDMHTASGKLSQMFRLNQQGIPVPDSFYMRRNSLAKIFKSGSLPENFKFPLIMKANDGSRGDDNHLVRSSQEALEVLKKTISDKQFLLQNYIANDGDYRFLFIGLENDPLIFLRVAATGTHLNNTSKGGTGTFIDAKSLPELYTTYARMAAETLKREISGVDIIVDKHTKKPYVLEVNGTPAIATGYGIEEKLVKFTKFLRQSLEELEEE